MDSWRQLLLLRELRSTVTRHRCVVSACIVVHCADFSSLQAVATVGSMPKVCSCVVACGRRGARESARLERARAEDGWRGRGAQEVGSLRLRVHSNEAARALRLRVRMAATGTVHCRLGAALRGLVAVAFSARQLRFCASSSHGRHELVSAHQASFRCSLLLTAPSSRVSPVVLTLHASQDGPVQPTQTDQLKFYGLFKQASIGDVNTSRPGMMGACVPPFSWPSRLC